MAELIFRKATVLCYRLFDIALEINLEQARRLLAEETRRVRLAREGSQYLQLPNPPLGVELGKRALQLKAGEVWVEATARVFDHGAASIVLSVPVPSGTAMEALIELADELYDSPSVEKLSAELVEGLRQRISQAAEGEHLWSQSESYTVVFAEAIEGNPSAGELLRHAELARLLLGEPNLANLSETVREEVTQHRYSYTDRDLAVVDWNSAFVYEPSGSRDIPDVLEICNAQLLEFRYYDELLDVQLANIHERMQQHRRAAGGMFRSPYKELARRVLATWLEMSEFIERVENSLKIIGDFYLARVYEGAVRRLRVTNWQASVTRKQRLLAEVYQFLKGELDIDRSLTLESIIVVLIVVELLIALLSAFRH